MTAAVVLGFVAEANDGDDDYEPTFYDTYFGGRPTFASAPSAHAAPECATCATTTRFVLQAYNSIDDMWHLQLHLYACPRCTAWFVKRCVVRIDNDDDGDQTDAPAVTSPARKAAFGFDFDDEWGSSSSASVTPQTTPVKAKPVAAAAAAPAAPAAPVPPSVAASFEIQYIEVDYEPDEQECDDDNDDNDAAAAASIAETSATGQDDDYLPEDYEATDPFLKFLQRLDRAPGQLCRYGGKPLWPSSERPTSVPPCSLCGAAREFELQILPTLLTFLMPREARVPDFGSVFIYTCHCTGAPDRGIDEYAFVVAGQ
jgi:hypothetical protein